MTDEARALLIAAVVLSGGGFVGGRATAPVPPAEVRYIHVALPPPAAAFVPPVEVAPDPAPVAPVIEEKPDSAPVAPVEAKPLPPPKPKAAAKPKPKPEPTVKKPRAEVPRQRRPTADECNQMRSAGRSVVKAGGRLRGYSDAQIERALKDCGF